MSPSSAPPAHRVGTDPVVKPALRIALIAEILGVYAAIMRGRRDKPLPALVAEVRRQRGRPIVGRTLPPHRLASAVVRTMDVVPTDNRCLIRSLVLLRLLSRRSVTAQLVIGARPGEGFAAHAWVEHEGRSLLPRGNFEPLARL